MAESDSSKTWWGGWLDAAKEKTNSAMDMVMKDLGEFSSTMQTDTAQATTNLKSKINQENATAASAKVTEGISHLLEGISKALVVDAEDLEKTTADKKSPSQPIFDRAKARLNAIQLDPGTYCNAPENTEKYQAWLTKFDLNSMKGNISELLVVNTQVRGLYTQLVPSEVSHADFWQRYFFKVHMLDKDEERKAALMRRATDVQETKDLEWDDDEWCDLTGPSSPIATRTLDAAMKERKEADTDETPVASSVVAGINDDIGNDGENIQTDDRLKDVPTNEHSTDSDIVLHLEKESVTQESITHVATETEEITKHEAKAPDRTKEEEKESITHVQTDTPSKPNIIKLDIVHTTEKTEAVAIPKGKEDQDKQQLTEVEPTELKTKEKGDMIVVGTAETPPSSDSSIEKETLEEEWEKEFDIEVTDEDMKMAVEAAKKLAESNTGDEDEDDWENWD